MTVCLFDSRRHHPSVRLVAQASFISQVCRCSCVHYDTGLGHGTSSWTGSPRVTGHGRTVVGALLGTYVAIARKSSDNSVRIIHPLRKFNATMHDGVHQLAQSQRLCNVGQDTRTLGSVVLPRLGGSAKQLAPGQNPLCKSLFLPSFFVVLLLLVLVWTVFVSGPAPHANRLKSFRFWFHAG